jgi:hypothetical protein
MELASACQRCPRPTSSTTASISVADLRSLPWSTVISRPRAPMGTA